MFLNFGYFSSSRSYKKKVLINISTQCVRQRAVPIFPLEFREPRKRHRERRRAETGMPSFRIRRLSRCIFVSWMNSSGKRGTARILPMGARVYSLSRWRNQCNVITERSEAESGETEDCMVRKEKILSLLSFRYSPSQTGSPGMVLYTCMVDQKCAGSLSIALHSTSICISVCREISNTL